MRKTFWRTLPLVLLIAAMVSAAGCGKGEEKDADGRSDADMPMLGGNPARTGVHPGPGIDGAPEVLWKAQAPGEGVTPLAVVDGTVYGGSYGGYVFALDAKSGEERWQTKLDSWRVSPPTVINGAVYVAGDDALYALGADDGKERWRFTVGAEGWSSPAVAGGVVYIGAADGNVYAIDAASGTERWRFQVAERGPAGSAAIANGVVYADGDPFMWALDAETGEERWRFKKSMYTDASSPVVADGKVFLSNVEFSYVLDAAKGEEVWHARSGDDDPPPAAVANGLAYFMTGSRQLSAFDAATGEPLWTVETWDRTIWQPVVVGDTLYLGGLALYLLDAKTGNELSRFRLTEGEPYKTSIYPTVVGGVIYGAVCLELGYEGGCEEGNSHVYAIGGTGEPPSPPESPLVPYMPTAYPTPTPESPPQGRTVNPTRPVLIDGPGVWTLRDLGHTDVWLDRESASLTELEHPRVSGIFADPVEYLLRPNVSQGPDLWYYLHFHFEVIFEDEVDTVERGYQGLDVSALTNTGTPVRTEFQTVWQGDALVVNCRVQCKINEKREGNTVTVGAEMWLASAIPIGGVQPGSNTLRFAVDAEDLPPRFRALHIFDDTYIEVSTTSPYEDVTPPPPP